MRRSLAVLTIAGTALTLSLSAQSRIARAPDSSEHPFVSHGWISLDLTAGEYRIVGTAADRIRLEWSTRDPDDLHRVQATADVDGDRARVRLDGPLHHFQARIEVPMESALEVRLSAGELRIEDVVGDKDVRLNAGELRIDVGDPEDYGRVDASLMAGELRAEPFRINKDGLFRSFHWEGDGAHRLRVKQLAGEIDLYSEAGLVASRR